jgi:two-component system phosphate regulon response regulator PhoB
MYGVGIKLSNLVDVHVNRLRSLVKINDEELPFIKTVRASGYCLNLPGERD